MSGGPSFVRKPGVYRSNLELTTSLGNNFIDAKEQFAPAHGINGDAAAAQNGLQNGDAIHGRVSQNGDNHNGNGDANGHDKRHARNTPLSLWTERDGDVLYVPRINWGRAGLQEEPSQYDITVKLFFLGGNVPASERAAHAGEALDLTLKELRVPSINLLIVSYPGMSFDGDCEWEADKLNSAQGDDEAEYAAWSAVEELHHRGLVEKLGIAEFGSQKLARFLKRVRVPPTVDQINIKNCCNVPPPLTQLAKEQGIELLVHGDCTNILSEGTLRGLLGHGDGGAGVLAGPGTAAEGLRGDLTPQWVVKYTAVVRNRGVIENMGFFAGAQLNEA